MCRCCTRRQQRHDSRDNDDSRDNQVPTTIVRVTAPRTTATPTTVVRSSPIAIIAPTVASQGQRSSDYVEWCTARGHRYDRSYSDGYWTNDRGCYNKANDGSLTGDRRAEFLAQLSCPG